MKQNKTFTVAYRRKREGKTDYKKRLRLLVGGKPRLVVRRSMRNIIAQVINYSSQGDTVVACASAADLKKLGWHYNSRNTPSAYLIGALAAKKAKEKGVSEAILDLGMNKSVPGCRVYAVLKGAVDAGLTIPHSAEVLPKETRVNGKHIEDYANNLKKDQAAFTKKFNECIKNNADPTKITKVFADTKKKIIGA